MLNSIGGFGTFLFFALINVCFLPIIYVFYPGMPPLLSILPSSVIPNPSPHYL